MVMHVPADANYMSSIAVQFRHLKLIELILPDLNPRPLLLF